MSKTVRVVITRALRLLGVNDPEQTPSDTQAENGLDALNGMVFAWASQGVDIGHQTWTLDSDIEQELDPPFGDAVTALLAVALLPEFPGATLSPAAAAMAVNGWAALQAFYFDSSRDSDLTVDSGLRRMQANRSRLWGSW